MSIYADPRWHVYVAYNGGAWIEGPFATEDDASRHREALRRRKGDQYYLRLVRRETPEADRRVKAAAAAMREHFDTNQFVKYDDMARVALEAADRVSGVVREKLS